MKAFAIALFVLAVSQAARADEPRVKFELLVDGMVIGGGSATGYMGKPETHELTLTEKPLGAIVGLKRQWSNVLNTTATVGGNPVAVELLLTKMEADNGSINWWAQVSFGKRIAAAVGGPSLTDLRLMANGAPRKLKGKETLEPRAIVDFK